MNAKTGARGFQRPPAEPCILPAQPTEDTFEALSPELVLFRLPLCVVATAHLASDKTLHANNVQP